MSTILYTLWRMSFQACILILIVLTARLLLKKYSGLYTRLLWLLVLVRLLCPVFIETKFSLLPDSSALLEMAKTIGTAEKAGSVSSDVFASALPAANQLAKNIIQQFSADGAKPQVPFHSGNPQASGSGSASATLVPPAASGQTIPVFSTGMQGTDTLLPAQQPTKDGMPTDAAGSIFPFPDGQHSPLVFLLSGIYLLGAIGTALVFCVQFFLLKRRISTAVCESGNVWLCENIVSPFIVGILHPRIILPYHMQPQARAHVLSHERTHIRHHDPLLHFAGSLSLCLHWWNPLVWVAVYKMNQDMEMFCDESTLRLAAVPQRKAYAKTLLSFAEQQSSLHAGPAFGESNTERRVKNIMQKRKKNTFVFGLVVLLTVLCAAVFMTIPKPSKSEENPGVNQDEGDVPANSADAGGSLLPDPEDGKQPENGNQPDYGILTTGNPITFSLDPFSVLQLAAMSTPDFAADQDMDVSFWKNYLFSTFTGIGMHSENPASAYIIESVTRYCEQYGSEITYNKIMAYDVDEMLRTFFGRALSEWISDPYSLADGSNIIYEDGVFGSYYIATSDSQDFTFGIPQTGTTSDGKTKLVFPKYPKDGHSPISQITLYLEPAQTEYGYIIVGKEETAQGSDAPKDDIISRLSYQDISFLQRSSLFMPDFAGETDLDIPFWKDYLFHCYSRTFDGEKVSRYSKRRDMTTAYVKVSAETLDAETRALFGKALSEYVPDPQDLSEEDGDIIYEDGNYYIRIPYDYNYVFEDTSLAMENNGSSATLTFYPRVAYNAYPSFETTLRLVSADNENGYLLVGKHGVEYDFTLRALTGAWAVTGYFIPPHSPAGNMPQAEIEQYVGTQLKFRPDSLTVGKDIYPVDGYRKESVTAGEFGDSYQLNTEEDLSISAAAFDCYHVQTAQDGQPFGSLVYRYDFESALVVHDGIVFRLVEMTENLEERTVLDGYEDIRFALPDENGVWECSFLPSEMLPGSNIYYTDDTHYIIIKGGVSPELDTPQKVEESYAESKKTTLEALQNGIKVLPSERPSDGMIVTYDMYGRMMHTYPRDYPQKKLAEGYLNWRYDDETYRAVVCRFDTAQPKLYYQAAGKDWEIYPLPGLENLTEEEADSIVVTADAEMVVVTVTIDGKESVMEIEVNQ